MFQLSAQSNGKPSTNVKVILGPSCSFRNPDINRPVKYILFHQNLFGAFQNMAVTLFHTVCKSGCISLAQMLMCCED